MANKNPEDKQRSRVGRAMDKLHADIRVRIDQFLEENRFNLARTSHLAGFADYLHSWESASTPAEFLQRVLTAIRDRVGVSALAITTRASLQEEACTNAAHSGFAAIDEDDLELAADNPLLVGLKGTKHPLLVRDLEGVLGPRSRHRAMLRRIECDVLIGFAAGGEMLGVCFVRLSDLDPANRPDALRTLQPMLSIAALILHNRLLQDASTS
jgi:hypothetical protein